MSLNCNEINLILNELDLKGAFIQDIISRIMTVWRFILIRRGVLRLFLFVVRRMNVVFTKQGEKSLKMKSLCVLWSFCVPESKAAG